MSLLCCHAQVTVLQLSQSSRKSGLIKVKIKPRVQFVGNFIQQFVLSGDGDGIQCTEAVLPARACCRWAIIGGFVASFVREVQVAPRSAVGVNQLQLVVDNSETETGIKKV